MITTVLSILGLTLALCLVGGVCFFVGYFIGHSDAQPDRVLR